jgi:uncharacterized protein YbcI
MTQSLEEEISAAISRFHRDEQGHEPETVKVHMLGDMVLVRCHNVFTPTERDLAQTSEGKKLIQSARRDQRAISRREIEAEIGRITESRVLRSFYDIDTRTGEQVEVYVLDTTF